MASESSMQAAVYREFGETSVLSIEQVPIPDICPDEVLIKVHGSGVNPVDWKIRKGFLKSMVPQELPTIPGWDVAGTVERVGSDVTNLVAGDEVFSYNRPVFDAASGPEKVGLNGDAAEFVAVKASRVAKKPASIDFASAAAVPLAGLTAWQGLFEHGQLSTGQSVLILNASGGVGSFAVQFAKHAGAFVIGTCSSRNAEYVKGLGADAVVDYTQGSLLDAITAAAPNGTVDLVYDCIGGDDNVAAGISALRAGGRMVSIAHGGVDKLTAAAGEGRSGVWMFVYPSAEQLALIAGLIDSKKVKIEELHTLPLTEIAKAHEMSESHRTRGKIVLLP